MKYKIKEYLTILILLMNVFFNESYAEGNDLTDVGVWFYQNNITLLAGESIEIFSGVYSEEKIRMEAYWLKNGEGIDGYVNSDFVVNGNRDSSYEFFATEEMEGTNIEIGFVINTYYTDGSVKSYKKATCNIMVDYPPEYYNNIQRVMSMVQPVNVTAVVNTGTNVYKNRELTNKTGWVDKGTTVIYDTHHKDISGHVILPDGSAGWVGYYRLTPSNKDFTVYEDFSLEDKNTFVNAKGYTSDTDYLVWVNLQRQKVNVFINKNGSWALERVMVCAAGANRTPTVRGIFKYNYRQSMWDLGSTCVKPILGFYESYALHSIILYKNGRIYDGTLGRPASHGCVRLSVDDINWLDKNLPFNSAIVIH